VPIKSKDGQEPAKGCHDGDDQGRAQATSRPAERRAARRPVLGRIPALCSTTTTGAPLYAAIATRAFQDHLQNAGSPRMAFTTCGTAAPRCSWPKECTLAWLWKILGHATLSTTMQICSHVIQGAQREAADKLDSVLAPKLAPWGRSRRLKSSILSTRSAKVRGSGRGLVPARPCGQRIFCRRPAA
jgi:hypothetical protein